MRGKMLAMIPALNKYFSSTGSSATFIFLRIALLKIKIHFNTAPILLLNLGLIVIKFTPHSLKGRKQEKSVIV